ncbi:carboxypeptidase B-like [Lineus longissimus]|uniref:carboxypeptidase B-like n=1 Tax=Lineus longissimus TaxID=88925 RepID=UPI002B4D5F2E
MPSPLSVCIFVAISGFCFVNAVKHQYNGDKVFRVFLESEDAFQYVEKIIGEGPWELDEWARHVYSATNATIDIRVPKPILRRFRRKLRGDGIRYKIVIHNLQSLIDDEMDLEKPRHRRDATGKTVNAEDQDGPRYLWDNIVGRYVTFDEIMNWIQNIADTSPLASIIDIGKSFEGRPLKVLKLNGTRSSDPSEKPRPGIWLDGGIHAREWISPATMNYIIFNMVQGYGKIREITDLLDYFDWYFMPVSNPDGYEYSMTTERLWRKSRSISGHSFCRGVDLNRNFGHHWMDCKPMFYLCASSDPCRGTFAGDAPFSEKESIAMSQFLKAQQENDKFVFYFSLHSFSQIWLLPWGYTKSKRPADINDLTEVAQVGVDALNRTHGTSYTMGSPASILYAAGGNSLDWAKGVAKIKYSYILELRDTGEYGFLLPESHIMETAEETFNGIKAAVSYYVRKSSLENEPVEEKLALFIETVLDMALDDEH